MANRLVILSNVKKIANLVGEIDAVKASGSKSLLNVLFDYPTRKSLNNPCGVIKKSCPPLLLS